VPPRKVSDDDRGLTSIRPGRGLDPWAIVAGLIVVVGLGVLGRLVPGPAPAEPAAVEVVASMEPGVLLVSPFADVLHLRTTEVSVRGAVPESIALVDVAVLVDGQSIGEARIDVDTSGQFSELVSIVPPAARSAAVLEVRDAGSLGRLLAQVSFAVQAGALVLPVEPSKLRGEAGSTLVVDVLVYEPRLEIRGMLTSVDGKLIATGSTLVGPPRGGGSWPRTIGLSIEIPFDRLPARARLHVLAFDRSETEVEHIDANVALSNG
jgi:hypothetical protein